MLPAQKSLYLDLVQQAGSLRGQSDRCVRLGARRGVETIAWILGRTSFTAVVVRLREDKIVRRWEMMSSVYGDVVWSRIPLCRGGGRYIIIRLAELAFRAYVFVMSYPRIVTSSPEYRKRSFPYSSNRCGCKRVPARYGGPIPRQIDRP